MVEDEDLVRQLTQRVLEEAGYTVLLARNGREALEVLARKAARVDLVLVDLVMPELGGRELGRRLALDPKSPPVLYMSGYTGEHVAKHGLLDPGAAFVQKPFAPGRARPAGPAGARPRPAGGMKPPAGCARLLNQPTRGKSMYLSLPPTPPVPRGRRRPNFACARGYLALAQLRDRPQRSGG